MGCCSCSETTQKCWTFGCVGFTTLLGLVLIFLWPPLALKLIHTQLVLQNGTINYESWVETPIPMYFEVYMFNWTNSDQVHEWRTVKPHFSELGPYVFLEKHYRRNVVFHDNDTVSFNTERVWEFVEDRSVGSLDDEVTNINPIDVTVGFMTKSLNEAAKMFIDIMLNDRGSLFNTKTVREWLFEGYPDRILDLLKSLNATDFPPIPFSKFGWFVERNGSVTHDGTFNMFTGADDISKLGMLDLWNFKQETGLFPGQCGRVYGTTGELNPPMRGNEDLSVFSSDVCRTLTLKNADTFSRFGIKGRKWIGDSRVFDYGQKVPEHECYCAANTTEECQQLPTGVYDASTCQFGAPAFVSFPHFYLADPSFLDDLDGLSPNKSLHEFYIALEPSTGIPLEIRAQLQISLKLEAFELLKQFENVPTMLVPMIWFRQLADLTEDLANESKMALMLPNIGVYLAYVLFAIGFCLLSLAIYLFIYPRGGHRSNSLDDLLIES